MAPILKKQMRVLAVFLVIVLSIQFSGCLALYPLKKVFVEEHQEEIKYTTETKAEIYHKFITTGRIESVSYRKDSDFQIIEKTLFMRLIIDVTMISIPVEYLNETLPDQMVELTLSKPDGLPWLSMKFNTSYYLVKDIPGPEQGTWNVSVYAVGYGFGEYSDNFKITIEAREPIQPAEK